MREAGQMRAILLAEEHLRMRSVAAVVQLQRLIVAGSNEELTLVVKVQGRDMCFRLGGFEELRDAGVRGLFDAGWAMEYGIEKLTLVGR